jgi:hypothetical protein
VDEGVEEGVAERIEQRVRRASPPARALLPFEPDDQIRTDVVDMHSRWDVSQAGADALPADQLAVAMSAQTHFNSVITRLVSHLLLQLSEQAAVIADLETKVQRSGQEWAFTGESTGSAPTDG